MKVKAIKCNSCGDIVYSRTEEDLRRCGCGAVSAHGGQSYSKFEPSPGSDYVLIKIDINADPHDIYRDWSDMIDSYGLIKGSTKGKNTYEKASNAKL